MIRKFNIRIIICDQWYSESLFRKKNLRSLIIFQKNVFGSLTHIIITPLVTPDH